jgi:hypothetical protein
MHEALGLHTLSFDTLRGETCAHQVRLLACPKKRWDTVGELKSAAICVSYMPSLKAKTLGELAQVKVLLEL